MRIFALAMLAVCGVAMFAVAALVWDRRKDLSNPANPLFRRGRSIGLAGGSQPAGTGNPLDLEDGEGSQGAVTTAVRPGSGQHYTPHWIALGSVVGGMVMIIASCAGLLSF